MNRHPPKRFNASSANAANANDQAANALQTMLENLGQLTVQLKT